MDKVSIAFDISTTDAAADLGLRVRLNSNTIYENAHITKTVNFSHDIEDEEGQHELEIELFGKRSEHTKIDDAGKIIKDAMLTIDNVTIDDIDVTSVVTSLSKYHHDFNGTQGPAENMFYGPMGCNGVVKLNFTTPVYLWILENT